MGSTLFREPQTQSSVLAALGSLQPRSFGSLNRVDPLDSVSNYYIHLQDLLIHLQVGVHGIYTPPTEQSDWSEFTTMVEDSMCAKLENQQTL